MTDPGPSTASASPISGLRNAIGFVRGCIAQISARNLSLVSAGVAFFVMLSLFPALAALIALLSLIADPTFVVAQLEDMRDLLPDDVYEIINAQVVTLVNASSSRLGWAGFVSIVLALWSARAGVGAMIIGLNTTFSKRNRSTFGHYVRAVLLTVSLVSVGVVAMLSLVVVPVILAFFPLGAFGTFAVDILRWMVAISVLFIGIGLLYRFGPNRKPLDQSWFSTGAVIAVSLWVILSIGFSYYVANFGNYNRVYGSIGAVVAMLVWLWISSFVVLLGAVINSEIEKGRTGSASDAASGEG